MSDEKKVLVATQSIGLGDGYGIGDVIKDEHILEVSRMHKVQVVDPHNSKLINYIDDPKGLAVQVAKEMTLEDAAKLKKGDKDLKAKIAKAKKERIEAAKK